MVRRIPSAVVLLGLLALLLPSVLASSARADVTVIVGDFVFIPQDVTIDPGETVTWSWFKGFHTTTNGTGDSDPQAGLLWDALVFAGAPTAQMTFTTPGVYPYYCRFHIELNMVGSVTVRQPPTSTEPTTWGAIKSIYSATP